MEYHDPSGVFPLISRDIAARLPLRNLNWQSRTRPLRQIRSLHVEFVPDKDTTSSLRPSISRTDSNTNGVSSLDIVRSGADAQKAAPKERRHQIPGLKTSPYLKIYVLRCDDKEGYKDSERQRIREWIKENALAEARRDSHDACEWLIIHVVIPDTVAASEPRWRESSSKDSEELKERSKGGKWPGKGNRTVFDRLRSDFNEHGKSAQDRIAQIRLVKGNLPPDLLPTPPVADTLQESNQERENAWHDLVGKFKSLILGPFDLRVRQYEADIAEQEARRSIPGWNFCTFFIHKEGLAKALESIGLVEDALAIYDELSLDLETVLREIAAGKAKGTATSFAHYTEDVIDRITRLPKEDIDSNASDIKAERVDVSATVFGKDYRELIVRSTISVFDFFCYIFFRQKTLLLRIANARSARVELGINGKDTGEDLVLTSEVCWRASTFIHNNARVLRRDLTNRYAVTSCLVTCFMAFIDSSCRQNSIDSKSASPADIEGLVCSWTYSLAGLVLEETAAPVLLDITKAKKVPKAEVVNGGLKRSVFDSVTGANVYPQRTTSLSGPTPSSAESQRPQSAYIALEEGAAPVTRQPATDNLKPEGVPGQAELATYRAEIILMRRRMLEQLAERKGWRSGWASVWAGGFSEISDISPEGSGEESATNDAKHNEQSWMLSQALHAALEAEQNFQSTYEILTNLAIRHYFAATHSKPTDSLMGDLALLKSQQLDYSTASAYFEYFLPRITTDGWNVMEIEALKTYAKCLKELNRKEDHVRTVLTILDKICARKLETQKAPTQIADGLETYTGFPMTIQGIMAELILYSEDLQNEIDVSADKYFTNIRLHREVLHPEDSDGFKLRLSLQHLMEDDLNLDEISVRLVHFEDSFQEIVVASDSSVALRPGLNELELSAAVVAFGPFFIDKIVLKAKRLRFVHHQAQPKVNPPTTEIANFGNPPIYSRATPVPYVYLYPGENALNAIVEQSRKIYVEKARQLQVVLKAGWNDIESIELRVRPTLAGLRLHLADATFSGIDLRDRGGNPGQLSLGHLNPYADAVVSIPYTLEQVKKDITIRLEIQYKTPKGDFRFQRLATFPNTLPLDVDVHDTFHLDRLFSDFMVRTTERTPILVLDANLKESAAYAVRSPPQLPLPLAVYNAQPLRLIHQITRKEGQIVKVSKENAALAMVIRYQSFEELISQRLKDAFVEDLSSSNWARIASLLVPFLADQSQKLVDSTEIERSSLLGEAKVPSFEAIGWPEIIATLPADTQSGLGDWLQKWHSDHTFLAIEHEAKNEAVSREMVLCVDVPSVDVVFSASLELPDTGNHSHRGAQIVAFGEPVSAVLRIRHTGSWGSKRQIEPHAVPKFVCDVQADSGIWLVGGQRRCHFTPRDGDEHTFSVIIVPLRLGSHPLPLVDIQVESPEGEEESTPTRPSDVSCETHYETAGRIVHIVRDSKISKILIEESPATVALPPSRPGTAST